MIFVNQTFYKFDLIRMFFLFFTKLKKLVKAFKKDSLQNEFLNIKKEIYKNIKILFLIWLVLARPKLILFKQWGEPQLWLRQLSVGPIFSLLKQGIEHL